MKNSNKAATSYLLKDYQNPLARFVMRVSRSENNELIQAYTHNVTLSCSLNYYGIPKSRKTENTIYIIKPNERTCAIAKLDVFEDRR